MNKIIYSLLVFGFLGGLFTFCSSSDKSDNGIILGYEVDLKKQDLRFFWKDAQGNNYQSFQNLKDQLQSDGLELVFAANAGMYQEDLKPLGLYIEDGEEKHKINRVEKAYGNFYLQPNGVFAINNSNKAIIQTTKEFKESDEIKFATQSGPMLLIDGKLHPKLMKGSSNLNIRNGVGVLPNGNLLFAISKEKINFYDFANYFKNHACENALYLDGFVSRTYLPSKGANDLGGNFGVIIGEVRKLNK